MLGYVKAVLYVDILVIRLVRTERAWCSALSYLEG